MWSGVRTLALALWAPLLVGALAAVATWLVWHYTALPCTPENAVELKCQPGPLARYISTTVLHHCVIHASIAITITGGSDIMLFLRERKRNEEERQRSENERQRSENERQRSDRMLELIKETMDQAADERRQAEERAAEERRQAAIERQAFLDALNRLTEAINQNGRGRS